MPFNPYMLARVVRDQEKPVLLGAPLEALLAAWQTTAPTPTIEQLAMVLDPKA